MCLLAAAALTTDCSCDDETTTTDGASVKFDIGAGDHGVLDGARPDAAGDAAPDAFVPPDTSTKDLSLADLPPDQLVYLDGITAPAYEYVVDSLTLPTSAAQIPSNSADLDGDGKQDNALGDLLTILSAVMPGLDLGAMVTLGVDSGETIHLFRLHASSLTSEPSAKLKSWIGKPAACCKTPSDPKTCATEADSTCFNGSATFSPDPLTPVPNLLGGAISGGTMSFGPAPLKMRVVIKGLGTLPLRLKGALISGAPTAGGIGTGVIGGAIDPKDLINDVIPALAKMIDVIYKDPTTDSVIKGTLASFLDTNGDGTITGAELANNTFAKAYMQGDVDLDKDGLKELSMGLGFTAVPATIN